MIEPIYITMALCTVVIVLIALDAHLDTRDKMHLVDGIPTVYPTKRGK